ncbi:hypothetical protein BO70DRAFT_366332 [Aspergillus heteromorphus CBS 117.55]|uniref:Uncharacterized protein n=1 Tax=Aspergillus heteromorphus CBS 117.55 TaxID=1448321 RepID=A0A317UYL4_9EURO|nr:uncharacterized protein BO70DRAFT_366332 [Aspergillus heteromorphus CBS 117.55]PWY67153.1 hypothetical protein BO70DRAFT_366332 [Aspergillus heteromorphus CBS 117.55]
MKLLILLILSLAVLVSAQTAVIPMLFDVIDGEETRVASIVGSMSRADPCAREGPRSLASRELTKVDRVGLPRNHVPRQLPRRRGTHPHRRGIADHGAVWRLDRPDVPDGRLLGGRLHHLNLYNYSRLGAHRSIRVKPS